MRAGHFLTLLALASVAGLAMPAIAEASRPSVQVMLRNDARAPSSIVAQAQSEVGRLFV